MNRHIVSFLIIMSILTPGTASPSEFGKYLPNWMELLKKGDKRERVLALDSLWFLEYPEFRKDAKVFDPVLEALLKDKEPSVREEAAGLLKRIGDYSKGCCQDTEIVPSLIKSLEDRNAQVRSEAAKALGYYKDKRAIVPLMKGLKDKEMLVRLNAAFSLGELKAKEALLPLSKMLMDDSDWRNKFVQQECVIAIRKIGVNKEALSALIRRSNDPYLKEDVTRALKFVQQLHISEEDSKSILAAIEEVTQSPDEKIRKTGLEILSRIYIKDDNLKLRYFIRSRKDPSPVVRVLSVRQLGIRRIDKVIELLLDAVNDTDETVRAEAIKGLWIKDDRVVAVLIKAMNDNSEMVRIAAARALGAIADKRGVDSLLKSLKDKNEENRTFVIESLGKIGDDRAVDPLIEALNDPSAMIREKVIKALDGFKNEKILDAVAPFLGKIGDGKSIPDPAAHTFLSVAQRTFKENMKIYRKEDGTRFVSKEPGESEGVFIRKVMVHPRAADILINKMNDPDPAVRLSAMLIYNFEDPRMEPYLIRHLDDPSSQIRKAAFALIRVFGGKSTVPRVIEALKDIDRGVRMEAVLALGEFQDKRAIEPLVEKLKDTESSVKEAALEALVTFDDPKVLDLLVELLKNDSSIIRSLYIEYIKKRPDKRAIAPLISLIQKDPDMRVRREALESLGKFDDPRISDINIMMLSDKSADIKNQAMMNIKKRPDKRAVEQLIPFLRDHRSSESFHAAETLGKIGDTRALSPLIDALRGEFGKDAGNAAQMRVKAAEALGLLKDRKAVPALIAVINNPNEWPTLRQVSLKALGEIGDPSAFDAVKSLLNDKQFPLNLIIDVLAGIKDDRATAILIEFLNSSEFSVVNLTILSLLKQKNMSAVKPMVKTVGRNSVYAHNVNETLKGYNDPKMVNIIIGYLKDNDLEVRKGAVRLVDRFGDKKVIEHLKVLLEDPDVKMEALSAISRIETSLKHQAKPATLPPRATGPIELASGHGITSGYNAMGAGAAGRYEFIEPYQPRVVLKAFTGDVKWFDEVVVIPKHSPIDVGPILAKLKNKDPKTRREAADILGDMGDKSSTGDLIHLLKDNDGYVRQAAARGLGKIKDRKAVEPLIESLKDSDLYVRELSVWALGEINDVRAAKPMLDVALNDKEKRVKDKAFETLLKFKDPEIKILLIKTLVDRKQEQMLGKLISLSGGDSVLKAFEDPAGDKAKTVRNYISLMEARIHNVNDLAKKALVDNKDRGLVISELSNYLKGEKKTQPGTPAYIFISLIGELKDPRGLPVLLDILKNKDASSRSVAVDAIGNIGDKTAVEPLLAILANTKESDGIRDASARALGKLGAKNAADALVGILNNRQDNKDVRIGAASALGAIKENKAVDLLIEVLRDEKEDLMLRIAAASSLGEIRDKGAVKPLEESLKGAHSYLQHAVEIALRKFK